MIFIFYKFNIFYEQLTKKYMPKGISRKKHPLLYPSPSSPPPPASGSASFMLNSGRFKGEMFSPVTEDFDIEAINEDEGMESARLNALQIDKFSLTERPFVYGICKGLPLVVPKALYAPVNG